MEGCLYVPDKVMRSRGLWLLAALPLLLLFHLVPLGVGHPGDVLAPVLLLPDAPVKQQPAETRQQSRPTSDSAILAAEGVRVYV